VPVPEVQRVWREWFAQWGLPEELRLDNGCPWGGWFDLPTALELWLAGLGVEVVFNPPRQPRYNGVVERGHGTSRRWAEIENCPSLAAAQEKMNFVDRIQRERMGSIAGQSRRAAFPGLAHSGRAYSRSWEETNWDLAKAEAVLEAHVGRRLVSKQGQVSVCGRAVRIGPKHAGITVNLQYDSGSKMWVISAAEGGNTLRCVVATEITRENIMTLTMGKKA
jgi:hypothetical protein